MNQKPDAVRYWSYLAAALLLMPVGWWAHEHVEPIIAAWLRSL